METLQSEEKTKTLGRLDRLGIGLSALCMVHCVFTPVYLALIPVANVGLASTQLHIVFGLVLLIIAKLAFFRGYRLHKKKSILYQGLSGLALLAVALLFPHHREHFNALNIETILTIMGSVVLIHAHYLNMRYCKDSCCTN